MIHDHDPDDHQEQTGRSINNAPCRFGSDAEHRHWLGLSVPSSRKSKCSHHTHCVDARSSGGPDLPVTSSNSHTIVAVHCSDRLTDLPIDRLAPSAGTQLQHMHACICIRTYACTTYVYLFSAESTGVGTSRHAEPVMRTFCFFFIRDSC